MFFFSDKKKEDKTLTVNSLKMHEIQIAATIASVFLTACNSRKSVTSEKSTTIILPANQ